MPRPIRHHPLTRAPMAERANAFFERAWQKGWLPRPVLEPEELWRVAAKGLESGLESGAGGALELGELGGRSPEDAADFRLRLERLLEAIASEAALDPLGEVMAHGQLVRAMRQRLKFGLVWAHKPDLAKTPIAPPIIIIGHMRSGTTRIHKLLAADPALSHTRYCDAYHPLPARPDWRRLKGAGEIAMLSALNPWLQSIHPIASGAVEEELGWLAAALNHSIYEAQWHIPSYSAFSEAREAGPVYREFARILRSDAAHRGLANRPRVMKVPVFSENLPELLEQFPGSRLIIAHRERGAVLRSAVSLVANQMAVQSARGDMAVIEASWRAKLAMREERREAALARWHGPIAHLDFEALNADWQGEITRAYAQLDMELSEDALGAMRAMMAKGAKGKHLAHAGQLAGFASAKQA